MLSLPPTLSAGHSRNEITSRNGKTRTFRKFASRQEDVGHEGLSQTEVAKFDDRPRDLVRLDAQFHQGGSRGADQPQDRGEGRMTNQQEERPLSIGSAVQFTHKGKTIHGHLLQRQGRSRFAKVVDTEERTWRVPESALKHSGGARLATIITRHDKARADYRVGDEVTFTSPDGPGRGEIVKLNPKSAKGTLRRDMLERLLWTTPQGGRGKHEKRRRAAERRRGNGSAADGRAWAHGLDPRVYRSQEAPWRLPFPTPRDPDQPRPCPGGKRGADPGHRAARDRTRDYGTRGWPWTAVEGNGAANRSNAKSEGLRAPNVPRQ